MRSRHAVHVQRIVVAGAPQAARALLLLALLLLTLPTLLNAPAIDVDSQWETGMQMAAHQHMQWGPQVIWTYGPLGYLQYPMLVYSSEWRITVVVLALVSLVFVGSIGLFLWTHRAHLLWLLAVVAIFGLARGITSGLEVKLAVCMVVLSALAVQDRLPSRLSLACACLAGLSFALGCMVRGTELLVAEVSVPCVCAALLLGRRRLAATLFAGSFVIGGVAMWLAAGQSVANIPSYLRGAWEISSGYSSLATSAPSAGNLAISVLALVPIAVIGVVSLHRRALPLCVLMVPCAAWAVVTYKEGIVDGDPHRLIDAVTLMALLIMVAIVGATRFPSLVSTVACGGVAFVWLFLSPSVALGTADWNTAPPGDGSPGAVVSAYHRYAALFFSAADRTHLILQEKQSVRQEAGLSPGTVAAMRAGTNLFTPIDVGRAWAYDVAWVAGPVLQSYGAYTPWLQEADAATLQGSSRPDHVVMTVDWILDSWPQFEDAAALRALLANYHLSAVTLSQSHPGVLLFDRGAPALPPAGCTPQKSRSDKIEPPAPPANSYPSSTAHTPGSPASPPETAPPPIADTAPAAQTPG